MSAFGVLPAYINRIAGIVVKSYKGHVTVVPSPSLDDYRNVLSNVSVEQYHGAFQSMYIQSLSKMARIKSYFAIEREFDRYYDLLKA